MPRRKNTSVVQRFVARVLESLESLGATHQRVVAAVSGGPDSTALLLALNSLRRKKKLDLAAAHANHALRGDDSEADEQFVRSLCARLEVPLICRRVPVPLDAAERDEGIEATARDLRRQFFAVAARELDAPFVATAHTANDQAETVLHRVIRGTGLAGLAGIPVQRVLAPGVTLIRPLLRLRRSELLDYLAAARQEFCEDRSNLDFAFTRNRLRHELIPYIEQHFNHRVTDAIARLATLSGDAQAIIDAHVDRLARRAIVRQDAHAVTLRVSPLERVSRFVVCEMLRRIWNERSWPLQEVGYDDFTRVADLVHGEATACDLPGGVRAVRSRNRIVLDRPAAT